MSLHLQTIGVSKVRKLMRTGPGLGEYLGAQHRSWTLTQGGKRGRFWAVTLVFQRVPEEDFVEEI